MAPPADYAAKLGRLQVGIRDDVVVNRQRISGSVRYVVHDPITFQNHLFSLFEYRVLATIVPRRSLAATYHHLADSGTLAPEREDAFYGFVLRLHGMGLLQLPIVDADKLIERYQARRDAKLSGWYRVFFYHKIPLLNPDQLLAGSQRAVGWLFSRIGVALWTVLMLAVLWKCGGRLPELLGQTGGLLDLGNLPVLWVTLIALKALHEFGHGYACRRLGGEVPEMGIVFILMTPCAYMDASSSWKFESKWHRIGVALGGMYVESIVAGLFALVWAGTQPGLIHDVALNIVVLAGAVTVLFNLNPLVKFDGYFVFSDLLGVVNLQERASRFLKGFVKRFALGLPRPSVNYSRRERWLYGLYAPCSFVYRVFLAFTITGIAVMQWPSVGLALGAIFVWGLMMTPLRRAFTYFWSEEETEPMRFRARFVALTLVALVAASLALLPVSSSVVAPGVLDPRTTVSIRAPVSGFVTGQLVDDGAGVETGNLLCILDNPDLEVRRIQLEGDVSAERIRMDVAEIEDPALAVAHRERLAFARQHLAEVERRRETAWIRASAAGTVVVTDPSGWLGRWVSRGEELFQLHADNRYVRIVLTDHDVLRAQLVVGSDAEVRWTCDPRPVRAVVREIRRSSSRTEVPVEVTMLAGGDVYTEPEWDEATRADQPYLHVFLEVENAPVPVGGAGMTARVRLDARVQTLGGWFKRNVLGFYHAWKMS